MDTRRTDQRGPGAGRHGDRSAHRLEQLLSEATAALGHEPRYTRLVDEFVADAPAATEVATSAFGASACRLWERGWSPGDLAHVVVRRFGRLHAAVAARQLTAAGRHRHDGGAPHPRWQEQLERLEDVAADAEGCGPHARLRALVDLVAEMDRLPPIPPTIPPPGSAAARTTQGTARLDGRILDRVRALLAKAESTTFEEEAEAFTAKAQELISRHAIDEARLHTTDDVGEPSCRRLPIDPPYERAKVLLVSEVGRANRCRVVHTSTFGWVTVFGFEHDLDALELVSTSLLAQATAAMARHGPQRDAHGRSRTRSFRRSFLLGFAQRIGERLRQADASTLAARDAGATDLLPVLAAREDRIDEAVAAAFPRMGRLRASVSSPAGWWSGREAAEHADLRGRSAHDRRVTGG